MRTNLVVFFLTLLVLACCTPGNDKTPAPTAPATLDKALQPTLPAFVTASLDEPFQLTIDGSAQVEKDLTVTFVELIEDSRCPPDVVCVWAGQVMVLVDIKVGERNFGTLKLSTITGPITPVSVYTIEITGAEPQRASFNVTPPVATDSLTITLVVTRSKS